MIAVFFLALIGATDNSGRVALVFLEYATPEWPISWWVLIAFALGACFGYLMSLGSNVRTRVTAMKTQRELNRSTAQIEKLQKSSETPVAADEK